MSKVDDIKVQLDQFKKDWVSSHGCCDIHDFSEDIEYLLSKLQEAEEALELIMDETSKCHSDDTVKPWQISKQAIQQLRS